MWSSSHVLTNPSRLRFEYRISTYQFFYFIEPYAWKLILIIALWYKRYAMELEVPTGFDPRTGYIKKLPLFYGIQRFSF